MVGRGEASGGEFSNLETAQIVRESNGALGRAIGCASSGVFENARPVPVRAIGCERWEIWQSLQRISLRTRRLNRLKRFRDERQAARLARRLGVKQVARGQKDQRTQGE